MNFDVLTDKSFQAAVQLHQYLTKNHWRDNALMGPDPGVRFNYRVYRFFKGYLSFINWNDDLYYLQCQTYWTISNWLLFEITGEEKYREIATACSETALKRQRPDGAWDYPNPEWKGRVATTEGGWASIGLLETYRHTKEQKFLNGAIKWNDFMHKEVGFQKEDDTLAVNYFAFRGNESRIPNNTALIIRLVAEIADASGDTKYLEHSSEYIKFMEKVLVPSGEIPYRVEGIEEGSYTLHFQCFQYNAFQCYYFLRYYELTGDESILPLTNNVLRFLSTGIGKDGHAHYECDKPNRTMVYHTAALGGTFLRATQLGIGDYEELAKRAYGFVLKHQKRNGSFPHSFNDYGFLKDVRAYTRYLSMNLFHLLIPKAYGTQPEISD